MSNSTTNIGKAKGLCAKCEKIVYLKDFTILDRMCAKCQRIDCICNSVSKFKLNIFESCVKCETEYQRWLNEPFLEGKSRREFYELVSKIT